MNNNGKNNDNQFAKNKMPFDPINKHFTCPYRQKLKPNGTKMINGVLNDILYGQLNVLNVPIKKYVQRKANIGNSMNQQARLS